MGKTSKISRRPNKNLRLVRNRAGFFDSSRFAVSGYTIVEVMIFLAVTSALFVMIALGFQGQQARTEFSVATRELESRIRDTINDVGSGYYGSGGNFTCTVNASGDIVVDPSSSSPQGTNPDCIFVGKVLHFGIEGDTEGKEYNIMTVIGKRTNLSNQNVDSYAHQDGARPTILEPATENHRLPVGLVYGGMHRLVNSSTLDTSAVGFLSTLGAFAVTGEQQQDTIRLQYLFNPDGGMRSSASQIKSFVDDFANISIWPLAVGIAVDTVEVCFDSDATDQHVIYAIGGHRGSNTTGSVDTRIGNETCTDAGFNL